MIKLNGFVDNMLKNIKAKGPLILTVTAILEVIATGVAAYKAGIKAKEILDTHKKKMKEIKSDDKEAKKAVYKETAKKMVPVLAPCICMGGLATASILSANKISAKRIAVLSAAYNAADKSLGEWQKKVEEMVGVQKTNQIKEGIMKDKLDKSSSSDHQQIIVTGNGDVLCKDLYTNQEFKSSASKINEAIADLSVECIGSMYVSLNELYDRIGLPRSKMGDEFGWNVDDLEHNKLPIRFSAQLNDREEPCLCIDYRIKPLQDFAHLM